MSIDLTLTYNNNHWHDWLVTFSAMTAYVSIIALAFLPTIQGDLRLLIFFIVATYSGGLVIGYLTLALMKDMKVAT